ncbi:MAG: putative 2-aminoethylphosphonate ABC transporter ATP-binding protein [Hyphomicrobiaceae bacterium]|nr:putative 2-aminoethylphosphonate ABC transporter ATP-binding protein [Hyphomicrobiaceae bacterium]
MARKPGRKAAGNEQPQQPFLEIRNVTKKFGDFVALDDVSLEIHEGEFVCFLGPSGCGKTTLLRAIAGLDFQTSGRIYQRGRDISDVPPADRDFGIVFQSYALFPNLTVERNVSYGLVNRKVGRKAVNDRVEELLTLVGLAGSGDKYPAALSGGQQQRVALARALATSPGMLLLDEPLSALDAKVRERLRHEMKELQRTLDITTIMVTHDQEEALTMADRIVVMSDGRIEQVGSPVEIYRHPVSPYVADFIGAMNFLHGKVMRKGHVKVGKMDIAVEDHTGQFKKGDQVVVCIRPECVAVRDLGRVKTNRYAMAIRDIEFLGSYCRATLAVGGGSDEELIADFSINLMRDYKLERGTKLNVAFPKDCLEVYHSDARGIPA